MKRNKKPSSKGKIFYFIHAWLLLKLLPKVQLIKLIQLATPVLGYMCFLILYSNESILVGSPLFERSL
jgi:hypothetical protein